MINHELNNKKLRESENAKIQTSLKEIQNNNSNINNFNSNLLTVEDSPPNNCDYSSKEPLIEKLNVFKFYKVQNSSDLLLEQNAPFTDPKSKRDHTTTTTTTASTTTTKDSVNELENPNKRKYIADEEDASCMICFDLFHCNGPHKSIVLKSCGHIFGKS
ncbi:hypothetical protein DLAC_11811 [Tieghemostelium lacteum]|uniref:RING-type domain-containing protein n=1 Tax=Tieghemostelium lacteum TaxID=361077 RepID=A0A151Z4N2_TIELA|nr:hypothetical protein DLAC_11811 [Tieghemostelium lacteum]|eukprot:KYQ88898.1 hypothetical protein DLAC_11811 [Tieghemostelium lacteum]